MYIKFWKLNVENRGVCMAYCKLLSPSTPRKNWGVLGQYLFTYLFFIYNWQNTAKIFCFTWKIATTSILCQFPSTSYIHTIRWTYIITKCKYRISSRGVLVWNKFLSHYEKQIESSSLFKSKMKLKLFAFENEITYFWNILPD